MAWYARLLPSSLVLINRPRRDGTLSWRWYAGAVGGIRTHNLAVASSALYHSATTYLVLTRRFMTDFVTNLPKIVGFWSVSQKENSWVSKIMCSVFVSGGTGRWDETSVWRPSVPADVETRWENKPCDWISCWESDASSAQRLAWQTWASVCCSIELCK